MEIVLLVFIFSLIRNLDATHCDKILNYHDSYGYGIDISCDGLSDKNQNILREISVSNEMILKIDNSNLTKVNQSLFQNVHKIRYLQITNSTFLFDLNEKLFLKLTKLQHLAVQNTKLNLDSSVFQGLDNLQELTLVNTSLNVIPNNTFSNLTTLETLKLSHNDFRNMYDIPFCELSSIKYLDLDYNKIEIIGSDFFVCFVTENESVFKLNGQSLQVKYSTDKFYHQIKSTLNLIELNLSYNLIRQIEGFDWAPSLKYIDLSNNRLKTVSNKLFAVLSSLEKLNLENNLLVKIEPNIFSITKLLRNVNFCNNQISQIWLENLLNLEELDLSSNRISSEILPQIKKLPKLQKLLLNNNLIQSVPDKMFLNFSSLETLDLSGNNLLLDRFTFHDLSNLKQLIIKNCSLETLPSSIFVDLANLEFLDISLNKIGSIEDPDIFSGVTNLQLLNVSHNLIKRLSYEPLAPLRNLQVLDISGNRLQNFQTNLISLLPSLRVINIKSNLLSCQTLAGIIKFLKDKSISYTINEEFEYHKQNIEGIYCENVTKETIEIDPGFGIGSALGILFLLVLSCIVISCIFYKCLLYARRRRYLMDEIELL